MLLSGTVLATDVWATVLVHADATVSLRADTLPCAQRKWQHPVCLVSFGTLSSPVILFPSRAPNKRALVNGERYVCFAYGFPRRPYRGYWCYIRIRSTSKWSSRLGGLLGALVRTLPHDRTSNWPASGRVRRKAESCKLTPRSLFISFLVKGICLLSNLNNVTLMSQCFSRWNSTLMRVRAWLLSMASVASLLWWSSRVDRSLILLLVRCRNPPLLEPLKSTCDLLGTRLRKGRKQRVLLSPFSGGFSYCWALSFELSTS